MIHSQENVAKLAKMLLRTGHSGFPVVKYDEETKTEVAYGLITRPVRSSFFQPLRFATKVQIPSARLNTTRLTLSCRLVTRRDMS